jgi:hypothetical protein
MSTNYSGTTTTKNFLKKQEVPKVEEVKPVEEVKETQVVEEVKIEESKTEEPKVEETPQVVVKVEPKTELVSVIPLETRYNIRIGKEWYDLKKGVVTEVSPNAFKELSRCQVVTLA